MAVYHTPVMLDEAINALNVKSNGIYADLTFGGGGHSRAIMERLKTGRLVSFDQDPDALKNIPDSKKIIPVHGNFRYLSQYFRYLKIDQVDGILADLGVSMHQFEAAERGFTYRADTKLDMRMNHNASLNAAKLLNTYDEHSLIRIFRDYADIPFARRLAVAVINFRNQKPFETTGQLVECVSPFCRATEKNKILSRVFQAIRIEVNAEMDALKEMLPQANEMLRPGGRLVVLTYHSVEDRLVKNFMKTGNTEGKEDTDLMGRKTGNGMKVLTPKPMIPTSDEVDRNPAARSAKMRAAEKK